jgi:FkbM family methyltransferase
MISRILRVIVRLALVGLGGLMVLALFPGVTLLFSGVSLSPYCSRWKSVMDANAIVRESKESSLIAAKTTVLRTEDGLDLLDTPDGRWWAPHAPRDTLADMQEQQRIKIYGTPDSGAAVLDCGAHVGLFSRVALNAGASRVVAVEPNPKAVECLRRNFVQEIAAGRMRIVPQGIWDHNGELEFYDDGQNGSTDGFLAIKPGGRAIGKIPVTTIDALSEELGPFTFIKMDIKGAASRALRGGSRAILKHRPRLAISTEQVPDDPEEIDALVHSLWSGYRLECRRCSPFPMELKMDRPRLEIRPDVMSFR